MCVCVLSSLLVLMQESLESSSTSKFSELVMKVREGSEGVDLESCSQSCDLPVCSSQSCDLPVSPCVQCVWRVIRFLPASVEALDLDQTLLALHNFMMVFTRKRLRGLTSDLPYRTLKTLLHTLYKCTGPQVHTHPS